MASAPSRRIPLLQAGRAIAALGVVAYHASLSANAFATRAPSWGHYLACGADGVAFFFALSGFIIFWTNAERAKAKNFVAEYIWARLIRIYVPYLPIGVGIAIVYTVAPSISMVSHHWDWAATVLLAPGSPALRVAWTLQSEIGFYGLMGIFFYARSKAIPGIGLTALGAIIFIPGGFEFLLGVALAWLAMAMPALVPRIAIPRALAVAGDASYSIYLIHCPVISVTSRLIAARHGSWIDVELFGIAASLGAGIAYHTWVEVPAIRRARQLKQRHWPSPSMSPADLRPYSPSPAFLRRRSLYSTRYPMPPNIR